LTFGSSGGWRSCAAYVVGHFVPTTAVLTTPAQKKAKAFFCSTPPALLCSSGDDSKAVQLRQPLLSRHRRTRGVFFFSPQQVTLPQAQVLGGAACLRGVARGTEQRRGF